jgi:hypothetical protein
MKKRKRLKCAYCGKRFTARHEWLYNHFDVQHPDMPIKVEDIIYKVDYAWKELGIN